jgi:hypothetical protein
MISLPVLSVTGLIALLRNREPGYLRVGVDGIEHADMFRTRRARWEDIVDVTDKADKRARNPIVFVVKDAKPVVVPNADRYSSSGAALYWMTRHYWQHPENRDELVDGRALDRLRGEQFDPCQHFAVDLSARHCRIGPRSGLSVSGRVWHRPVAGHSVFDAIPDAASSPWKSAA